MQKRIHELIEQFRPQACQADPWPIHWISSGSDACADYCWPCGRAKARYERRHQGYRSARVDGGWDGARESDGVSYCHGCGRLLGYSLTRSGLSDEIDHWLTADTRKLSNEEAYQIEAILEAALYCDDDALMIDAVSIAERVSSLLAA